MRVEFYLIDAMEVLHFAPVLRALVKIGVDTTFVSCRGDANVLGKWYDADNAEALMDRLGLPFVPHPSRNADIAVTTQEREKLRDYRKLRARLTYGPMLTATFTSSAPSLCPQAHVGFDLYLVHGPFNRRISTQYVRADQIRMIGYPRFDAWFNFPLDRHLIRRKYGINNSKPAILYLPTWEHRSSIDAFADAVFALSDRFEVLVKPHHCTYRIETERMRKLNSGPVRVLAPTVPPEEPYAMADVVIADASSGTLAEAIFLDRRTVGIAAKGELEELLLPELGRRIPFSVAPQDLSRKVDEALELDTGSREFRELREDLFDTTDGADAARAAQAIVEFVEEKQRTRWSTVRTEIHFRRRRLTETYGTTVRRIKHPVRTLRRGLGRPEPYRLPILLYHNVGPPPTEDPFGLTVAPDQFEHQMHYLLSRGYQTIWPSDWLAARREDKPLPLKSVMVTFDDGYADMVEHAFPTLRRYGLKAAVYVVTRRLGLTNTWDEANGHRTMRLMSADQISEWAGQGIEFGAHTRTHPHLTLVSEQQLTDEIDGSKEDLQNLLGTEVLSFAYPYGDGAESRVIREKLKCINLLGMTVWEGLNSIQTNPRQLRRLMILPGDSAEDFERKLRFEKTLAERARGRLPEHIRRTARSGRRALRALAGSGSERPQKGL